MTAVSRAEWQLLSQTLTTCHFLAAKKVQNVADWTKDLDSVFDQNRQADSGVKWQYFASQTGFFSNRRASQIQTGRNRKPDPKYTARKMASQVSGFSGCSTYFVK